MRKRSDVFIIAEAGSNWKVGGGHLKDVACAKALIDGAAKAGADAVKFQVFSGADVYVPNAGKSDYLTQFRIDSRPINDIFKELAMPHGMVQDLADYCKTKQIEFMASFFSEADFRAVDPFVLRHKIASYEITHPELIRLAAESGKPLILSTGASTMEDIDWAVQYFKRCGGKDISLMQCTAKYPARLEYLHLRVIPELLEKMNLAVGFSDHSMEPVFGPLVAVSLGARIIEKHFTINKKSKGPDHSFALEISELEQMVKAIRKYESGDHSDFEELKANNIYETILGSEGKKVFPEEKELRDYAQRAVQAIVDIQKNEAFRLGKNIAILRPGKKSKGVHPKKIADIEGRKAKRFIHIGEGIVEACYV